MGTENAAVKGGSMAVFFDTGGGDIYAGETREQCVAAMLEADPKMPMNEIYEVEGSTEMRAEDQSLTTLAAEYTPLGYGYCIASDNC